MENCTLSALMISIFQACHKQSPPCLLIALVKPTASAFNSNGETMLIRWLHHFSSWNMHLKRLLRMGKLTFIIANLKGLSSILDQFPVFYLNRKYTIQSVQAPWKSAKSSKIEFFSLRIHPFCMRRYAGNTGYWAFAILI